MSTILGPSVHPLQPYYPICGNVTRRAQLRSFELWISRLREALGLDTRSEYLIAVYHCIGNRSTATSSSISLILLYGLHDPTS